MKREIHGRPRPEAAPLSWGEWQAIIATALAHFDCDPNWSEWDFLQHCLNGNARRKMPQAPQTDVQGPVAELLDAVAPFAALVESTSGRIPTETLSFAQWHALVKAYKRTHPLLEFVAGHR